MSGAQFMGLVAEYPFTYTLALFLSLAAYLFFYRKQFYSIFDPLCSLAISTGLCASDVVFLWLRHEIAGRYFFQFVSTEVAFLLGVMLFKPFKRRVVAENTTHDKRQFLIVLYVVSAIIFVLTQTLTYAIKGIPILYNSRLTYYSSGGGIGALDHVLDVTWLFSFYLLLYCVFNKGAISRWLRVFNIFVGAALVISPILSGSKGTFIQMVFVIFYFRFLNRGDKTYDASDKSLAKLQKYIAIAAIAAIFLVIGVQLSSGSFAVMFVTLYWRLADFGGVYFMAYPTHIIDAIPGDRSFLAVFGSLLGTFRIVPYTSLPEPLGFILHRMVYGFDNFTGPNDRHNVFGVVYFGTYGAILYSLTLGAMVGFIRNRLPAFILPGSALAPFYVFLATSCLAVTGGIGLFMDDVGSIILVVPALYLISGLVYLACLQRHAPLKITLGESV